MTRNLGLLLILAVASGCALDPYTRDGVWRPSAVNDANLRAMIADPRDLQQGASEPGADGASAAAAIQRLREDRVRPLPAVGVTGGTGPSSGAVSTN
jgi:hypothetical protein